LFTTGFDEAIRRENRAGAGPVRYRTIYAGFIETGRPWPPGHSREDEDIAANDQAIPDDSSKRPKSSMIRRQHPMMLGSSLVPVPLQFQVALLTEFRGAAIDTRRPALM
jgi:hypothetical protein